MIDISSVEQTHSSGAVPRRGVTIVRGSGAHLFDGTGRRWIDCSAAHGWAALGHGHPAVTEAIRSQAGKLVMLTESASNDARARWYHHAHRVPVTRIPRDRARSTLADLGGEFWSRGRRGALKFARFRTGRTGVVAFTRAFHGRTFGALSATAPSPRTERFAPLVPGFSHATYNDLSSADAAIGDETAAVIVEVVQGEGGVHEGSTEFLKGLERFARERGALLSWMKSRPALAEPGAGSPRHRHGLNPDIVVLGKAIGGGLPLGAAVWRKELGGFEPGLHGSTFAAAPLVCAASVAAMDALSSERLAERADRLGPPAMARIQETRGMVRAVRGRGLMIGVELKGKVGPVIERLMERGVWALPTGLNVLRLLPPLNIPEADLDEAIDIVTEVLRGE